MRSPARQVPDPPRVVAAVKIAPSARQVFLAAYAAARGRNGEVHAVHVVRTSRYRGQETVAYAHERLCELIEDVRALIEPPWGPAPRVFVHTRQGWPVGEIIGAVAAEARAELVVVGAHDERVPEARLARSVPVSLMDWVSCPILVVQPVAYDSPALVPLYRDCAACVEARSESGGLRWHCEQHARAFGVDEPLGLA